MDPVFFSVLSGFSETTTRSANPNLLLCISDHHEYPAIDHPHSSVRSHRLASFKNPARSVQLQFYICLILPLGTLAAELHLIIDYKSSPFLSVFLLSLQNLVTVVPMPMAVVLNTTCLNVLLKHE